MTKQGGKDLTQEEVWDDSKLVSSWNEAFEEYKKYHSLASKGDKIEPEPPKESLPSKAAAMLLGPTATATAKPSTTPLNFSHDPPAITAAAAHPSTTATPPSFPLAPAPPGLAGLPHSLLNNAQDEALKNIMMSWYYAGYYTGLYEGQQKAWVSMQEQQAPQDGT